MPSYKIKKRSPKWDSILKTGYYIYSRIYSKCKNGRAFRRYRMAGPYRSRKKAAAAAGMLTLKFNEFAKKVEKEEKQASRPDTEQAPNRMKMDRESVMKRWDSWSQYYREGGRASWPRDSFESLLDYFENEIAEAISRSDMQN